MMVVERGSGRSQLCPRCGSRLHRERRRVFHRMLSLAYPVRFYACTRECGWHGLLPHASGLERRKQQFRLLLAVLVLALATGALVWRYKSDIVWRPERPAPDDGIEEVGGES